MLAGPGTTELPQESLVDRSPLQPWGWMLSPAWRCWRTPASPCPRHGYTDVRKALPLWPQHHSEVGGAGTPLAIMLRRQKPINYPIHFPLLCWLFVAD